MKDTITLTPESTVRNMTKALPPIPDGAKPLVYDQVIPNATSQSGKPDPAHND